MSQQIIQQLIVGVIVASAAFFVGKRYLPNQLQHWVRSAIAGLAHKLHFEALAQKLDATPAPKAAAGCDVGCSACNNCVSAESPLPANTKNTITPDALKRTIRRQPQA